MNFSAVLYLLGKLLIGLGCALWVPLLVVLFSWEWEMFTAFALPGAITLAVGFSLTLFCEQPEEIELGRREACALVTAAWVSASLLGALPWIFHGGLDFTVDALFESTSGFTTTGASILRDIEAQPRSLLFWRSLSQWLGGMGIIVLVMAVLPRLSVGGIELLSAEATGPRGEKLTPRIAQTAKALWLIYAVLTAAQFVLLMVAGMSGFDAINHAFTTVATGGFSTRNHSVASFESAWIEGIVCVFMVLGAINFALHFQISKGQFRRVVGDAELRFFLGLLAVATLVVALDLDLEDEGVPGHVGQSLFQVVSVVTTTGYSTADFDAWPNFSRALLFVLMFFGGCAGSTVGSIKIMRVLIVLKKLRVDLMQVLRPRVVVPVRLGERHIPPDVVASVTTFVLLFGLIFILGGVLLSLGDLDLVTAFAASGACLTNLGPGFGAVGPASNYADLAPMAKILLCTWMVIGRLELYTVLVLLFAARWK